MPVSRQASRTRTVMGVRPPSFRAIRLSAIRARLRRDRNSNGRLIRTGEPSAHHFDEGAVSLKTELARLALEGRLVCDESQLMLYECPKRFGNKVEFLGQQIVDPAQPIKPGTEPVIEFRRAAAIEPSTKGVSEDRSLRRSRLPQERFELLRQVVRQVELVPRLEGFHPR